MSRDFWLRGLVAALLVLAVALIAPMTEWTEVEVPLPASGEAADNRLYAVQSLLRKLGATVVKRQDLDTLPGAGAQLVLTSRHWSLLPGRSQRLREWVEQGGHLVIPGFMADDNLLRFWLPVKSVQAPREKSTAKDDDAPGGNSSVNPKPFVKNDTDECREISEAEAPTADGAAAARRFRICMPVARDFYRAASGEASWSLHGPNGAEALRAALGRGTVTVIGGWWALTGNRPTFQADHAPILAAALQVRPGREIWFVAEEKREALLLWTWHQGWPAVLIGLLALGAALWRAAVRFGPLSVVPTPHRRSMSEQVRGTAHFLHLQGPGALHTAQLRAFDECARRKLRPDSGGDAAARTQTIARLTGLDAFALTQAQMPGPRKPLLLARDLEVLETARRRIDAHQP
jgi:Domain of unknown function (DUF4350)